MDEVSKSKGRNLLLVGLVCLGSFGKFKHELKTTKDLPINLKLGQFVVSSGNS